MTSSSRTDVNRPSAVDLMVANYLARYGGDEAVVRAMAEATAAAYEASLSKTTDEIVRTVVCTLPDCRRRQETTLDVGGDLRFDNGTLQGRFLCEECGEESIIPVRLRKGEVAQS